MDSIHREEGRRLFGEDGINYAKYRPPYPEKVFELLRDEGGLYPGCHTLEVGAGASLATTRLIELGAEPVVIVEPDSRFNPSLQQIRRAFNSTVTIVNETFEHASFAPASFDLAVSATAFHWVDQGIGHRKVADLLRRGGMWAMWWNIFACCSTSGRNNRPNVPGLSQGSDFLHCPGIGIDGNKLGGHKARPYLQICYNNRQIIGPPPCRGNP